MLFFAKYLSLHRDIQPFAEYAVTPCMGVWIETWLVVILMMNGWMSHPVWVCGLKLCSLLRLRQVMRSHPVWVCGLKQAQQQRQQTLLQVTPCMGVWIETTEANFGAVILRSHPVWVCGLKQQAIISYD